jgi:hypothetical protein
MEWLRGCTGDGYGWFHHRGKADTAPRWAYRFSVGVIPSGMVIRHKCDNRLCCNPEHLEIGTVADNNSDCVSRGRHIPNIGESNGRAKPTAEDVLNIRASNLTEREIACNYEIDKSTVHHIRAGHRWKHLPMVAEKAREA